MDLWVRWGVPAAGALRVPLLGSLANKQGYHPGVSGLHSPAWGRPLSWLRGDVQVGKRQLSPA